MKKKVYGAGTNDADYVTHYVDSEGKRKTCPFYKKWNGMLERCFSPRYKSKNPTYADVTCCEDWLLFSKFKAWMEKQDWKGKELDKDILYEDNKVYSPQTCVFIDHKINSFLNDCGGARGDLPIGVSLQTKKNKYGTTSAYVAKVNNSLSGECEYLGRFTTPEAASEVWRVRKHEIACMLAETQGDPRIREALRKRYYK